MYKSARCLVFWFSIKYRKYVNILIISVVLMYYTEDRLYKFTTVYIIIILITVS